MTIDVTSLFKRFNSLAPNASGNFSNMQHLVMMTGRCERQARDS